MAKKKENPVLRNMRQDVEEFQKRAGEKAIYALDELLLRSAPWERQGVINEAIAKAAFTMGKLDQLEIDISRLERGS